ncbi:MAG: RidA family protein, partial [Egibacteraceae bacterium]
AGGSPPQSHVLRNPAGLAPPVGFSHVALAAPGRLVFLAGQTAHQPDGAIAGETIQEQFTAAARNVALALEAAGAAPEHLVSLQIFVTDVDAYRAAMEPIGTAYRALFGTHYPPMALLGVDRLLDPAALVELVAVAVIPDPG